MAKSKGAAPANNQVFRYGQSMTQRIAKAVKNGKVSPATADHVKRAVRGKH